MDVSRLMVCVLCALAAAGCRSGGNNNNQALLERELRFQETELWRLRDQIDELGCQLDTAQRENDSLKKDAVEVVPTPAPINAWPKKSPELSVPIIEMPPDDSSSSPGPSPRYRLRKPDRTLGKTPATEPPTEIETPEIDLGPSQPPSDSMSPSTGPQFDSIDRRAPDDLPTPNELQSPAEMQSPDDVPTSESSRREKVRGTRRQDQASLVTHTAPLPAEGHAAKIAIVKHLTGGRDRDGRPGHEGITVGFEPLDDDGQFVQASGDVSIVLMDPAFKGPEAKVGRWDFKSSEAAAHLGGKRIGRGYYFDLQWSGQPPVNEKLQVFVRFLTSDGARLVADQNIDIALPPSKPSQTWNAARPRYDAAVSQVAGLRDEDSSPSSADLQKPGRKRFFSRHKADAGLSANATTSDRPPLVVGPNDAVYVQVDPRTGEPMLSRGAIAGAGAGSSAAAGSSSGADGSRPPHSTRFIDRTRLRGGPGLITFDGSMIRSWTGGGSAPPKNSPPAPYYRIDEGNANTDAQITAAQLSAAQLPAAQFAADSRYRPQTSGFLPGGAPTVASPNANASGDWVTSVEPPIGGPPMQEEAPVIEPPPAPRVSRPVWRPYR